MCVYIAVVNGFYRCGRFRHLIATSNEPRKKKESKTQTNWIVAFDQENNEHNKKIQVN